MEDGIWVDSDIIFNADGMDGNPIVLMAKNPGQVILSGLTDFRIAGDYLVVSGLVFENCIAELSNLIAFRRSSSDLDNYSRLTDCIIRDCNSSDPTDDNKWVGIYGTDNEVDHCLFENKTHEGACLVVWASVDTTYHHIRHKVH